MYRHQTHLAAALIHVALDFSILGGKPGCKSRKRRGMVFFIGKRNLKQRIKRIPRLASQPRQKRFRVLIRTIDRNSNGRSAFRSLDPFFQNLRASTQLASSEAPILPIATWFRAHGPVQKAGPPSRRWHKRALEHAGQRIIIIRQKHELHQRHDVEDGDVLRKLEAVGTCNRNSGLSQFADQDIEK